MSVSYTSASALSTILSGLCHMQATIYFLRYLALEVIFLLGNGIVVTTPSWLTAEYFYYCTWGSQFGWSQLAPFTVYRVIHQSVGRCRWLCIG